MNLSEEEAVKVIIDFDRIAVSAIFELSDIYLYLRSLLPYNLIKIRI